MYNHRTKRLLLLMFCLISQVGWTQSSLVYKSKTEQLYDFGEKTQIIADYYTLFSDDFLNYQYQYSDFKRLAQQKRKPKSLFNLGELSSLVERYFVFEKKIVRFGVIPPKIKISIQEKEK